MIRIWQRPEIAYSKNCPNRAVQETESSNSSGTQPTDVRSVSNDERSKKLRQFFERSSVEFICSRWNAPIIFGSLSKRLHPVVPGSGIWRHDRCNVLQVLFRFAASDFLTRSIYDVRLLVVKYISLDHIVVVVVGPLCWGDKVLLLGVYTVRSSDRPVGPTGRSDWSVRLVGPTIVSCKRFGRPAGQTVGRIKHDWFRPSADPTAEACGHCVQLVGPTGQSDDQSRCSVGDTCCLRHRYIAAAVIYTKLSSIFKWWLKGHIDLVHRCGRFGYSLSDRSVRLVWPTSRTDRSVRRSYRVNAQLQEDGRSVQWAFLRTAIVVPIGELRIRRCCLNDGRRKLRFVT